MLCCRSLFTPISFISPPIWDERLLNYQLQCGKQTKQIWRGKTCTWEPFCNYWRFPFDWKCPLGYFIAVAIQYVTLLYAVIVGACVIAFGAVSFLYVIASSKCIKGSLFSIGQCAHNETNQNILDRFVEFTKFHSHLKQLSKQNSKLKLIISEGVLFITFIFVGWSVIFRI